MEMPYLEVRIEDRAGMGVGTHSFREDRTRIVRIAAQHLHLAERTFLLFGNFSENIS